MTGEEREDFRELRTEMRSGFDRLEGLVTGVGTRVATIETARAVEAALEARDLSERTQGRANRRWRIGVILTASGAAAAGIGDLVLRVLRVP